MRVQVSTTIAPSLKRRAKAIADAYGFPISAMIEAGLIHEIEKWEKIRGCPRDEIWTGNKPIASDLV